MFLSLILILSAVSSFSFADELEDENKTYIEVPVDTSCEMSAPDAPAPDDDMILVAPAEKTRYCIQIGKRISHPSELAIETNRHAEESELLEENDTALKEILAKKGKWVLRFYFGPTRTDYFDTKIKIDTSQYQLEIQRVELVERTSASNYKAWEKLSNFKESYTFFQFIDEPTNTAIISFENTKHKFNLNLVIYHPKVMILDGEDERTFHQDTYVTGNLDGTPIDGVTNLRKIFGAYRLTYGFMNFQIQVEKDLLVYKGSRGGHLDYLPGASAGFFNGSAYISFRIPGKEIWEGRVVSEKPFVPIGYSYAFSNRLVYTFPGDFFSLSVMHQLSYGNLKYSVLDGYAEHKLNNQNLTVSAGFRIVRFRHTK